MALFYHNSRQLTIAIINFLDRNLFNTFRSKYQDLLNIRNPTLTERQHLFKIKNS